MPSCSCLFPRLGAVGLAGAVDGSLVLAEVDKRDGKTCKVGDIVVEQLGCLVHLVVETTVGHLHTTTMMRVNTLHSLAAVRS